MSAEQVPPQTSVSQKRSRSKKRKGRRKSPPQRTCVACRTVRSKRELLRVVRMPDGTVMIDPSGKQSGRGAYLCVQRSCWETALKHGSLDRALKITLDDSCKAELSAYMQTLPQPEESP